MIRQTWHYKWLLMAAMTTTALTTGLIGLQGLCVKELIQALTRIDQADPALAAQELQRMRSVALLTMAIGIPTGLMAYLSLLQGQNIANKCMRDLRTRFVSHLVRLDLAFHGELARGELLSRVTTDLDRMYSLQSLMFGKFVQKPAQSLGYLAAVFWAAWQVGIVVLIALIPLVLGIGKILKKTRRRSLRAQESLATSLIAFEQITGGIRVIKTMGSSEREVERYSGLNQDLYRDRQRVASARAQSEGITQGTVLLLGGGAMFASTWLFAAGLVSPIGLISAITFVGLLIGSLRDLQKVWGDIQENLPAAQRVYAVLDRGPTMIDAAGATVQPAPREAIRLNRVSFRYQAGSDDVLQDIDLEIPVGKVTALVGPSGGGKSTILDLVPRLRDVTGGSVTWDGVDVRTVQADSLIHHVAIVSQDSFLFNDTVRNNIRYGKPEASEADIEAAARRAHAHDMILALEGGKGYDTVVGDRGGRLSGGQRQRIAIARALLRDAPILLLDEPTSALDATSERHVQEALDELMRGRTTIVIAHRLATVQHADRIHVIGKRGEGPSSVLESGTHSELVALGGTYTELVRLQQLA
jgi:subfamily B ATP-binding cassette protein MsbA